MKPQIVTLLSLLILSTAHSQTKIIAHKSHSGNSHNFSKAYQNNLFDIRSSNFGRAPEPEVKNARLDSLIFVNDTCQIMVTTVSCTNLYGKNAITKEWNHQTQSWNEAIEISKDKNSSVWKSGRDTVYKHPLFSFNESLDFIKERLKNSFHFVNPIDSIVFVGYNNNKPYEILYPYLKVTYYTIKDRSYLKISTNGTYLTDGDCTPNIRWGIAMQERDANTWKTVLHDNSQLDCGLSSLTYREVDITLDLSAYWKKYNANSSAVPSGTYKIFGELSSSQERIYSNEFTIK